MSGDNGAPRPWRRPPAAKRSARARQAEQQAPPPHLRPAAGPSTRPDLAAIGHPHAHPAPAAHPARRADAGALAAAFGVDFLSWDESNPGRRGRALTPYVVPPVLEERIAATGWSGSGRQRGELALPGAVVALSEDRLLVHVRVRVTPFRRLTRAPACGRPADGRPADGRPADVRPADVRHSPDVLPYPAAAPAPAAPGWVGLDSYWYELLVPVREIADQWRVDIGAVIVVPPVPPDLRDGVVPP